jgi:hypothetical protein
MEQIRSFIAIELPDEVRKVLAHLEAQLKKGRHSGAKWVDPYSIHLTLIFLAAVMLLVGVACDRAVPLQIENKTDTVLNIYLESVYAGKIEPNKTIKIRDIAATFSYLLIEAKNSKGEVIYSRKFSFIELHDADWKVVILPLQNK